MTVVTDDIRAVANEILARGGGDIDPFKLQKLLYYTQVYHIVLEGKKAFPDKLEAWDEGPVNRSIWETFRGYSRNPIRQQANQRLPVQASVLKTIGLVMLTLGDLSGDELSKRTHAERPWIAAYQQGRNTEITMQNIKEGYVSIGSAVYALPITSQEIPVHLQHMIDKLHPARDNEELIEQIAEQNYSLLTELVLTHAHLEPQVMAMIVHGIASDWYRNPEAARKALLISLHRPEAWIQREALEGLDSMWRDGESVALEPQVAKQLKITLPKWVGLSA